MAAFASRMQVAAPSPASCWSSRGRVQTKTAARCACSRRSGARVLARELWPPPCPRRRTASAPRPAVATRSTSSALEPTNPTGPAVLREAGRPAKTARERLADFLDDSAAMPTIATGPTRGDLAALPASALRRDFAAPRFYGHAACGGCRSAPARDVDKFLCELGWREFSYHLLFNYPDLAREEFQRDSTRFAGASDDGCAARRGSAARPAIRSSTPACANSGRPAGCTTACA